MERKVLDIADLKLKDDGAGSFSGYASTFANWDSVKERPTRGAFVKHLPDFLKDGFITRSHDWSVSIGTISSAYEDEIGLLIEADFHSTPAAQEARTIMKERMARGKSVKLSIGYEVMADEFVEEGRLLKEIKLYEVAHVTVPANQSAIVLGAKSGVGSAPGLNEHIEEVVSALDVLAGRVRDRHDFRTKEGRVLSGSNRQRISTLLERLAEVQDDLNKLLADTDPVKGTGWAETHELRAQTFIIQQRLKALGVTP